MVLRLALYAALKTLAEAYAKPIHSIGMRYITAFRGSGFAV